MIIYFIFILYITSKQTSYSSFNLGRCLFMCVFRCVFSSVLIVLSYLVLGSTVKQNTVVIISIVIFVICVIISIHCLNLQKIPNNTSNPEHFFLTFCIQNYLWINLWEIICRLIINKKNESLWTFTGPNSSVRTHTQADHLWSTTSGLNHNQSFWTGGGGFAVILIDYSKDLSIQWQPIT